MKQIIRLISLALLMLVMTANSGFADKFAGDAFTLGAGARGQALGRAMIAGPSDGFAAYWNPATLIGVKQRQLSAMHAETFGELLNHDVIAYAQPASDSGSRFALGGYFYYLGGGGIKLTQLNGSGRPEIVREESHADMLFAGSIAKKIGPKLSLGGSLKVIYRDIGTETGFGLTTDLGATYDANEWLTLALVISDATSGLIRYNGGSLVPTSDSTSVTSASRSESIAPAVHPGMRISRTYGDWSGSLLASGEIRAENLRDAAQYWAGRLSLDTQYGLEIWYLKLVAGRVGLDNGRLTAGAGVSYKTVTLDLAYLHHDDFDATYRLSAGIGF